MFHIPNDKRAQKTADLIAQGLDKALQTKPYKDIKINDIFSLSNQRDCIAN